jgi:signal transduction histidine kinase
MAEQNQTQVDRLQAEVQLARAIDVIPTAFALFDAEDRLVISNREYERIYTTPVLPLVPGARFEDLLRAFAGHMGVKPVGESREDWMARRLGRRQAPAQGDQFEYGRGRWLEENDYLTADQSVITVAIEITERKRANDALRLRDERLKGLQAELLQSTKLTAMAELSSALAHELNQPMTAMISYLTAIGRRLQKSEDADARKTCHQIEKAVNQAHRASKIISGQRELVKTGRTARSDEHLNKAIEEAMTLAMDIPDGKGVSLQRSSRRFDQSGADPTGDIESPAQRPGGDERMPTPGAEHRDPDVGRGPGRGDHIRHRPRPARAVARPALQAVRHNQT